MAAPKGNKFWEARSSHGRDPIFKKPDDLWTACLEYFEWVEANPLKEEKLFQYMGAVVKQDANKMRAMTIGGLCIFLDICQNTWTNYKKDEDFLRVTRKAEEIIRDQKFSGASANLLNPNIIARDLGLKDASKQEVSGPDGGPIEVTGIEVSFVKAKEVKDGNDK
jgi:hypothetical protein